MEHNINDNEQNNNLSNYEYFQLDDNIPEKQILNYQKIYQNPQEFIKK